MDGISVYIRHSNNTYHRATANVVSNGSAFGVLIPAHVLAAPESTPTSEAPHALNLEPLAAITCVMKSADCAIATIMHPGFLAFLQKSKDVKAITATSTSTTKSTSTSKSPNKDDDNAAVIAHTARGPVHGSALAVSAVMKLPRSNVYAEVKRFAYEGTIHQGDGGTKVVCARTKEVYGFVIASVEHAPLAYVIPAQDVLSAIARVGDWRLVGKEDSQGKTG